MEDQRKWNVGKWGREISGISWQAVWLQKILFGCVRVLRLVFFWLETSETGSIRSTYLNTLLLVYTVLVQYGLFKQIT